MAELAAFISNSQSLSALKNIAEKGDILTATQKYSNAQSPAYLVVELSSNNADEAFEQLDKLAGVCHKDTSVIVTGDIDGLGFYKKLISMGVAEYLLNPITAEQVQALVKEKAAAVAAPKPAEPRQDCKVIALIGARGGVGASTLATNLASVYAAKKYPTALLDFDPEFGTIPLMFDVEPSRGLVDAMEKPDRVDTLFLDRALTKVNDNLFVLGAERSLTESVKIDANAAEVLLEHLKTKFGYVIIDISQLKPHEYFLLKNAQCVLVTELSLAGLRDTMRIYDLIKDSLGNKDITIVANKVGLNKKFETPQKDFEQGLGKKIDFIIPFDVDSYGYFENGKTMVVAHPTSKFSKGLTLLANKFMPDASQDAATPDKKPSLLDGFLKKK